MVLWHFTDDSIWLSKDQVLLGGLEKSILIPVGFWLSRRWGKYSANNNLWDQKLRIIKKIMESKMKVSAWWWFMDLEMFWFFTSMIHGLWKGGIQDNIVIRKYLINFERNENNLQLLPWPYKMCKIIYFYFNA